MSATEVLPPMLARMPDARPACGWTGCGAPAVVEYQLGPDVRDEDWTPVCDDHARHIVSPRWPFLTGATSEDPSTLLAIRLVRS